MRKRWLLVLACIVCLGAAGGVLVWTLRPEPPPSTAEEVLTAIMETDPAALSEPELDRWIAQMASTVERLPPHELQKLVGKALGDEALRQRFESLSPEQRQKMANLISEEQRARMMARMASGMVAFFKAMPAPLRHVALREMAAKREAQRGKHPKMTKERFAQWHAATTPRQRAEMVRAMREMRTMLEEAGIRD